MRRFLAVSVFTSLFVMFARSAAAADLQVPGIYSEIQAAIDAALDGDRIIVAPGEYLVSESVVFRDKSVTLVAPGGPDTTTIRLSESDEDEEPSSVVAFAAGEGANTVIEGFTLTGGTRCGVLCVDGSAPTLTDCKISGNPAKGVLCLSGSSPTLIGCEISENEREGIECGEESSPTVTNCTIAMNYGYGVFCWNSSPTLNGSVITGNYSSGLTCRQGASPSIAECTISDNFGSGVCLSEESSPELTRCTIERNTADEYYYYYYYYGHGGALSCTGGSAPILADCILRDNTAISGGAVYCEDSSPTLRRCTITQNASDQGSALYSIGSSNPQFVSSILWNNLGATVRVEEPSNPQISYSCVEAEPVWPGDGNINLNPLFCGWPRGEVLADTQEQLDAALLGDDYSLSLADGSPCRGSGEGAVDMGAGTGHCGGPSVGERLVRLGAGTFAVSANLQNHVSLQGAGKADTVIEGSLSGLRGSAFLADLTVTGGGDGVRVTAEEAPEIRSCNLRENGGVGVYCTAGSTPTLTDCVISENHGGGVVCEAGSAPILNHATVTANFGFGLSIGANAAPSILNSIVWDNPGGAVHVDATATPTVDYSCVEGQNVWPGLENTNADPLFCGWPSADVAVTDQAELDAELRLVEFGLGLSEASPCKGTAEDGGNMGADAGVCAGGGQPSRLIRLGDGTFSFAGLDVRRELVHRVSVLGAGSEVTTIAGGITGLRTGAFLADLTVDGGGVTVDSGEAPEIARCTIVNAYRGIQCFSDAAPTVVDCVIARNSNAGIRCYSNASLSLIVSTLTGNNGGGLVCDAGSRVSVRSSILWDNGDGPILTDPAAAVDVFFSCVETQEVWPGVGNINADPLFCGWATPELLIQSQEELDAAFADDASFQLSLADESPCLGAGEGGSDMGAATGVCVGPMQPERTLRLAAGTYSSPGDFARFHKLSLEGAGEGETIIEGGVSGLRTGTLLRHVTVTGSGTGIFVGPNQAPEISQCTVSGNEYGVICDSASPTLTDCTIVGNEFDGLTFQGASSPTVSNCRITDNSGSGITCRDVSTAVVTGCMIASNASQWGGIECRDTSTLTITDCSVSESMRGFYCVDGSSLTAVDCVITRNATAGSGAGVFLTSGSAGSLTRCTLSENKAGRGGGGILVNSARAVTIADCVISNNTAGDDGGGISSRQLASPVLTNCVITHNAAPRGGGLSCQHNASPTLENCLVTLNESTESGGGIRAVGNANLTVVHSTLAENRATSSGGGVFVEGAAANLSSSIVWGNTGGSIDVHESRSLQVSNSCVEGEELWPGVGNRNDEPLFCGWESDEVSVGDQKAFAEAIDDSRYSFGLAEGSPCIDAAEDGTNMGADTGVCAAVRPSRLVRLSAGTYQMDGSSLDSGISLQGSGADVTVIEGTVKGLRTGAYLADLTSSGGDGIRIGRGESPELRGCTFSQHTLGVLCDASSSPSFTDCTISGNAGWGVFCGPDSSPTFDSCVIAENEGSGVRCASNARPTLRSCTIARNTAERGAGVYSSGAIALLTSCLITENVAQNFGGGIYLLDSDAELIDCAIEGNLAVEGGGLFARRSSPTLNGSIVTGNSANAIGGGFLCDDGSSPTLTNCIVAVNSAGDYGSGLSCQSASAPTLINCTLAGNSDDTVESREQSSPSFTNCIVWGNGDASLTWRSGSSPTVNHSCIDGDSVWPGEGNINLSPLFLDEGLFDFDRFKEVKLAGQTHQLPDFAVQRPDYFLQAASPCRDTGTLDGAPGTDLEGFARACGSGVDMGAFESGSCAPFRFLRGDCNGDGKADISDGIFNLNALFVAGSTQPGCLEACNANRDATNNLADAVYLFNHLFVAGPPPGAPYPVCGTDPERASGLGCGEQACE